MIKICSVFFTKRGRPKMIVRRAAGCVVELSCLKGGRFSAQKRSRDQIICSACTARGFRLPVTVLLENNNLS